MFSQKVCQFFGYFLVFEGIKLSIISYTISCNISKFASFSLSFFIQKRPCLLYFTRATHIRNLPSYCCSFLWRADNEWLGFPLKRLWSGGVRLAWARRAGLAGGEFVGVGVHECASGCRIFEKHHYSFLCSVFFLVVVVSRSASVSSRAVTDVHSTSSLVFISIMNGENFNWFS